MRAGDRYRSPAAGASTALSSECGQCHVDNGRGMRLNADLLAGLYCRERRVAWRGVCVRVHSCRAGTTGSSASPTSRRSPTARSTRSSTRASTPTSAEVRRSNRCRTNVVAIDAAALGSLKKYAHGYGCDFPCWYNFEKTLKLLPPDVIF